MAQSGSYEAAVEVRGVIEDLTAEVAVIAEALRGGRLGQGERRDDFAGRIMAALVAHQLSLGQPGSLADPLLSDRLASVTWQLADALDLGDPYRKPNRAAADADDEEDMLDLNDHP